MGFAKEINSATAMQRATYNRRNAETEVDGATWMFATMAPAAAPIMNISMNVIDWLRGANAAEKRVMCCAIVTTEKSFAKNAPRELAAQNPATPMAWQSAVENCPV